MSKRSSVASPPHPATGRLARPLEALVFLLPLLAFYEYVSLTRHERVIAFDLLRRFFELFGQAGYWLPGLLVVVVLLATHVASGQPWTVRIGRVGWMYVESIALAAPLLVLNWVIPSLVAAAPAAGPVDRLAMGIGAGIYEELVFRLILISLIMMVGVDLLGLRRSGVAIIAVIVSSVAFAAHHHRPIGEEAFDLTRLVFRSVAGVYLAGVFWFRGYGPAAGAHAAYNTVLALLGLVGR